MIPLLTAFPVHFFLTIRCTEDSVGVCLHHVDAKTDLLIGGSLPIAKVYTFSCYRIVISISFILLSFFRFH